MKTEMIEFMGNGSPAPGYVANPQADRPLPGVVVIQEWWGLNEHIQDVTRRMAAEGFVALAPDLYRGVVAAEPGEARKLAMELDRDRAVKDIQGAVNYLIAQPDVLPKKVGIIGFCMGGGLAGWMASVGINIGAVSVFYGARGKLDDETAASISAPFLGIYGEADASIPLDIVRHNESMLKKHGKICEFHIYADAPHAFFNDTRASYRETYADDAWQKTIAWFKKHLIA